MTDDTVLAFRAEIRAVEHFLHANVSMHDYNGEIAPIVTSRRCMHHNGFCSVVKRSGRGEGNRLCRQADITMVQRRLTHDVRPFLKFCHAGVVEVVVPIAARGALAGALFAGPFRWNDRDSIPDDALAQKERKYPGLQGRRHRLATLSESQTEDIVALLRLLVYRLESIPGRSTPAPPHAAGYRERIESFLLSRVNVPVSLPDLASHLCLSSSRTSQLVRRRFGTTFPRLVARVKLDYACALLRNTHSPVETVARWIGMDDVTYFHRLFKKTSGMTPGEYRKRHAGEEGA